MGAKQHWIPLTVISVSKYLLFVIHRRKVSKNYDKNVIGLKYSQLRKKNLTFTN